MKLHSDSRHLRQFQIFSFQFAIKKFDLKTPGREDDDDLEAEKKVELGSNDYTAIAAKIPKAVAEKKTSQALTTASQD